MIIPSSNHLKEIEKHTLRVQEIENHELMERAAVAFVLAAMPLLKSATSIGIVCGTGNNGGDGLAIARLLWLKGYAIQVIIVGAIENASHDCKLNFERLIHCGFKDSKYFTSHTELPICQWYIDALLGSGLNRAVGDIHKLAIEAMNDIDAKKIAVDLPSGMYADLATQSQCVCADYTIAFGYPKMAFYFPENDKYLGKIKLLNIGLDAECGNTMDTHYRLFEPSLFLPAILFRNKYAYKSLLGHSLIIAGSKGKYGAAELSAKACLVTGAGLVTVACSEARYFSPELMTVAREDVLELIHNNAFHSIVIGPGMGTSSAEFVLLESIITQCNTPVILDADALTLLAANRHLLNKLNQNCALTPHPGEYERLFGKSDNELQRIEQQKIVSITNNCTIAYKKAHTVTTNNTGKCTFNNSGNAGMASAGSGDVLTGIIAACINRGKSTVYDAVCSAVYLHGLAGDMALEAIGGDGIIASDIVNYIPQAKEKIKTLIATCI